jgi:hypothetical protein
VFKDTVSLNRALPASVLFRDALTFPYCSYFVICSFLGIPDAVMWSPRARTTPLLLAQGLTRPCLYILQCWRPMYPLCGALTLSSTSVITYSTCLCYRSSECCLHSAYLKISVLGWHGYVCLSVDTASCPTKLESYSRISLRNKVYDLYI